MTKKLTDAQQRILKVLAEGGHIRRDYSAKFYLYNPRGYYVETVRSITVDALRPYMNKEEQRIKTINDAGRQLALDLGLLAPQPDPDKPTSAMRQLELPSDELADYDLPDADDDILKPTDAVEIINAYSDFYGAIVGTIFEIDPEHSYSYGVAYQINGKHHRHYFGFNELVKVHAA